MLEKVIEAINICLGHGKCIDCRYHSDGYSAMNCRNRMLQDALRLLKQYHLEKSWDESPERMNGGIL